MVFVVGRRLFYLCGGVCCCSSGVCFCCEGRVCGVVGDVFVVLLMVYVCFVYCFLRWFS